MGVGSLENLVDGVLGAVHGQAHDVEVRTRDRGHAARLAASSPVVNISAVNRAVDRPRATARCRAARSVAASPSKTRTGCPSNAR